MFRVPSRVLRGTRRRISGLAGALSSRTTTLRLVAALHLVAALRLAGTLERC